MESPRWNVITPSQYEWERRGLDFIRTGLPDHDPYRAWSNFEFQTHDGAIYEVDLLVLTKQGFWLVECKAWSGRITGDTGTWTLSQGGKLRSEDNPVLLANRKAKALSSLVKAQPAVDKIRVPWLDALVFLSGDDVQCDLTGAARNRVLLKDRPAEGNRPERSGILAALINRVGPGIDSDLRTTIDSKVSKAISRAIELAGVRPSQRSRRVGDYILGDLIADGPGYQDRLAKHASFDNVFCRVRQYTRRPEHRQKRTANDSDGRLLVSSRSFKRWTIKGFSRSSITRSMRTARRCFRYLDPNAVRFDHYLATHCHKLTTDQRLDMLHQIADAT